MNVACHVLLLQRGHLAALLGQRERRQAARGGALGRRTGARSHALLLRATFGNSSATQFFSSVCLVSVPKGAAAAPQLLAAAVMLYSCGHWQCGRVFPEFRGLTCVYGLLQQVTLLVFLFGFGGFLAVWSGLWQPSGPNDPGNTILFGLLNSQGQQARTTLAPRLAFPLPTVALYTDEGIEPISGIDKLLGFPPRGPCMQHSPHTALHRS